MRLVIRKNAGEMMLTMMIFAIASMLTTRLYLKLTGYPQIGRGDWHVAHAFLGGLIMVGGMVLELAIANFSKKAVVVFGFGLGWFIDEIGKFLSRDNDYFFQPAVMIIYIFFVLMFLLYRYLDKRDEGETKPTRWWIVIKRFAYYEIFKRRIVLWLLLGVAMVYTVAGVFDFAYLINRGKYVEKRGLTTKTEVNMFTVKSAAEVASAGCFGLGIFWVMKKKKRRGVGFFQIGLLINIFIASVAKFYFEQLSAVFGLGATIAVYYGLDRLKKEL